MTRHRTSSTFVGILAITALAVTALAVTGCSGADNASPTPTTSTASVTTTVSASATTAARTPSPSASKSATTAPGSTTAPGPKKPASKKKATTPVIAFAGMSDDGKNLEINAYAPVLEMDGKCSATVTGKKTVTSEKVQAEADASTTWCDTISIPTTKVTPGTWTVRVTYESGKTSGTSEAVKVRVS